MAACPAVAQLVSPQLEARERKLYCAEAAPASRSRADRGACGHLQGAVVRANAPKISRAAAG